MLLANERTNIIKTFVNEAMGKYQQTTKCLPEQVIIYRDGMGGPSMTVRVKEEEVKVIADLLENTAPGYRPKIVYCLVDRNVQHRLFDKQGPDYLNPGPGTVVDTSLVEVQGDTTFDFFLVPHKATVATAKPVLYRVVYNTTQMNKN
jgi:hypothetical protein